VNDLLGFAEREGPLARIALMAPIGVDPRREILAGEGVGVVRATHPDCHGGTQKHACMHPLQSPVHVPCRGAWLTLFLAGHC